MKTAFLIVFSFIVAEIDAQEIATSSLTEDEKPLIEDLISTEFKICCEKGVSVGNQLWFNKSISLLSAFQDQIILPENNLFYNDISAIDIYRAKGWNDFQYSYVRKVALEIERREDNRDW